MQQGRVDLKKKLDMLEELQEVESLIDTLKANQSDLHAELSGISQGLDVVREEVEVLEVRLPNVNLKRAGWR